MVEIIGHRGYAAAAPENTLASLEAALTAGARAVEFDLHVASCGTPVLFHDVNLGRTTNGVGPVRRLTLGQLQAMDALCSLAKLPGTAPTSVILLFDNVIFLAEFSYFPRWY